MRLCPAFSPCSALLASCPEDVSFSVAAGRCHSLPLPRQKSPSSPCCRSEQQQRSCGSLQGCLQLLCRALEGEPSLLVQGFCSLRSLGWGLQGECQGAAGGWVAASLRLSSARACLSVRAKRLQPSLPVLLVLRSSPCSRGAALSRRLCTG